MNGQFRKHFSVDLNVALQNVSPWQQHDMYTVLLTLTMQFMKRA